MSHDIQAPQDASADTQQILKELEAEGKGTPAGQEPAPKAEPVKAESATPEATEETKADESQADTASAETANKKPEREAKYVPVSKHNEERHKRQEAERRAEEAERRANELESRNNSNAASKPSTDNVDARANRLAEKHGLEPDFVKDLLLEVTPSQTLPPELQEDIRVVKELRAQQERHAQETAQETHFNSEFGSVIKEFPELADRKEELKQLAFSEGNINTSLRRLALEFRHDNPPDKPGRRTAEAPVKASKGDLSEVIDFAEMTEEQFKGLNGEQLAQFEKWIEKNPRKS